MVPVTTGHFLASDACLCSASANSAMTKPNAPKATTSGDTFGCGEMRRGEFAQLVRPNAEPNTIASTIAVPMPRQPHRPFGRSRSSTASLGCSGL